MDRAHGIGHEAEAGPREQASRNGRRICSHAGHKYEFGALRTANRIDRHVHPVAVRDLQRAWLPGFRRLSRLILRGLSRGASRKRHRKKENGYVGEAPFRRVRVPGSPPPGRVRIGDHLARRGVACRRRELDRCKNVYCPPNERILPPNPAGGNGAYPEAGRARVDPDAGSGERDDATEGTPAVLCSLPERPAPEASTR